MKIMIIVFAALFLTGTASLSQTVTGKLKFTQGQVLEITMNVKTKIAQEAMGQSIDFSVDGAAIHLYKVTNATDDNNTLHHKMQRINYIFDGMGQKQSFDSDKPKDLQGQFGKPIKEIMGKTYDMVIDSAGRVMMSLPEKIETSESDPRMMMIMNLLKELVDAVQPPKKNEASLFKVLPDTATGMGGSWTETFTNETGKSATTYKITDINDSTVVVEFSGNSVAVSKAEMMGMETTTTMKNKTTGKIILDRKTGIMRQKTSTTDSNGTTDVMGQSLPATSKTTLVIDVKPQQ